MNKNKIIYSILGSATVIATTSAIAVPLVITKIAKSKLEAFVPNGGSSNSLSSKNKINYVALGDSETAGFVGVLKEDYRSYSDFLSKSLKNANKLNSYHNLAVSGERLADINKDLFESPDKVRVIKNADLITLTLGANDILAYLKILNIPFQQALGFISDQSKLAKVSEKVAGLNSTSKKIEINPKDISDTTSKEAYDILDSFKPYSGNKISLNAAKARTEIFGNNPNLGVSKNDSTKVFENTISSLQKLATGDKSALFNIDSDWWPKVFDLIKRQYVLLIRDLHEAAPNAQIRVIGHLFPFGQYNKDVYTVKKPELDNNSILDGFNRMLSSMNDGAKTNIKGKSKFVKFENANNFKEIKETKKDLDFSNEANFKASVLDNPMPNITDIHPSVFGYQKLGEHLFKEIGKEMGLSDIDITSNMQQSYLAGTVDDPNTINIDESKWTREDENDSHLSGLYGASRIIKGFTDMSDNFKTLGISDIILKVFNKMKEGSGEVISVGDFAIGLLNDLTKPLVAGVIAQLVSTASKAITSASLISDSVEFAKNINIVLSNLPTDPALIKAKLTQLQIPGLLQKIIILLKLKGDNLVDLINTSNVLLKQLKEGEQDKLVTNEKQWILSQWGLATIFKDLFALTK